MFKPIPMATLCLLGLSLDGLADTLVVDSIHQQSPPGAVNSEQVLIIQNDEFGNQRTLRIGHPGGSVTRPKPCKRDEPVAGMDCTGKDLREVRWDRARVSGSQFDGADLRGASLSGAQLENASFNDARLDQADLSGTRLINCEFNNASLSGARLSHAQIINSDFMDADLSRSDLTESSLINAELMDARLEGATWLDGRRCREGSVGACRR
jgi:hypothetical protein